MAKSKERISVPISGGFVCTSENDPFWKSLSVPGLIDLVQMALEQLDFREPKDGDSIWDPEWPAKVLLDEAWREVRRITDSFASKQQPAA
jgi:hypothetical protein